MTRIRSVLSRPWQLASSACAVAAAVGLVFLPTGSSQTSYADSAGHVSTGAITHTTLLQVQGPSVLITLSIPVVLTLIGLLSPARARLAASVVGTSLLGVGVFLGMLSIGLFFIPALVCSIVAIARSRNPSTAPTISGDTLTA
jgi:hypothetical protein